MLHLFWPSLLLEVKGFVTSMMTPIVKARKGKEVLSFYTMTEYQNWLAQPGSSSYSLKYYKASSFVDMLDIKLLQHKSYSYRSWNNILCLQGLGTSKDEEAQGYFKDLAENQIEYVLGNSAKECNDAVLLAFDKKQADARKTWLSTFDRDVILEHTQKQVPITEFINKDLIHFSNSDNIRSIPSMCDGLKPSHRKVLYACLKKLRSEMKVSQLAGLIGTETSYHHGTFVTVRFQYANHCGDFQSRLHDPQA